MSLGSVFLRVILLIMVFLLGFMCCIGAIVGAGVYVYKNVSLDTFPIDTDAFIDPDAEVDLTALSIEGLIAEFQQLSTLDAEISLDLIINRYGFIIPAEVEEYLPATLTAMPIEKLFSMEGVMEIADSVYVGRLLQYERVEGSEMTAAGWVDSSGKEVVGLNAKIADYSLGQLLKGEISVDALINDITVADVLSMTSEDTLPVYIADGEDKILAEGKSVVLWYDSSGACVTGVVAALAPKTVTQISGDINAMEISSIVGFEEYNGVYYSAEVKEGADGSYVLLTETEGLMSNFADLTVEDFSGTGIDDKIDTLLVADLAGYTKGDDGKWYVTYDPENPANNQEVDAIMGTMADLTVADIKNGGADDKIGELTVAELSGYVKGDDGKWYVTYDPENPENNQEVDAIMGAMADLSVDEITEGEANNKIQSLTVAELSGYVKGDDGKWYVTYDPENPENNQEVDVIMSAMADLTVEGITDGEANDKIGQLTVAELSDYTYVEGDEPGTGKWYVTYDPENPENNQEVDAIMSAMADLTVDDIRAGEANNKIQALTVAELSDYTYVEGDEPGTGKWYVTYDPENPENNQEVDAIMSAMADLTVKGITDGEANDKIRALTVAELSGYVKGDDDKWYMESGEQADPIMSALAGLTINEVTAGEANNSVKKLSVAEISGYVKGDDGEWYVTYDPENPANNKKADVFMSTLADLSINEISAGEADTAIRALKVADLAGYTMGDDDKWYTENGEEATGILASFADLTVDEMTDENKLTEKVQTVTVADALGYDLGNDGKYYNNGNPVTGIMAVIAGTQLNSIEDKVNNSYMGDMLGFTYNEEDDSWYDGDEKVHVLMQAVSRTKFNNVSSLADTLTIADLIPAENRSEGLMSLLDSDTKLDEMPDEMSRILNETTVGDLINCNAIKLDGMSEHEIEVFMYNLGDKTLPGFIEWTTDLITKPGFDAFIGADS